MARPSCSFWDDYQRPTFSQQIPPITTQLPVIRKSSLFLVYTKVPGARHQLVYTCPMQSDCLSSIPSKPHRYFSYGNTFSTPPISCEDLPWNPTQRPSQLGLEAVGKGVISTTQVFSVGIHLLRSGLQIQVLLKDIGTASPFPDFSAYFQMTCGKQTSSSPRCLSIHAWNQSVHMEKGLCRCD